MDFKNFEGKLERESPKRTIYTSGGLELLQMVSESDTRQCVGEEAKPQRGWTQGSVPARTLGPEGGWIEGFHIIGEGNECQQGRWAPKENGLSDPTLVGRRTETFFIRVWKPLPSRRVLKSLSERKTPKEGNIC